MSLSKKVYCTYICKSPGKKVVNSSHFIIAIANHFDILQLEKGDAHFLRRGGNTKVIRYGQPYEWRFTSYTRLIDQCRTKGKNVIIRLQQKYGASYETNLINKRLLAFAFALECLWKFNLMNISGVGSYERNYDGKPSGVVVVCPDCLWSNGRSIGLTVPTLTDFHLEI